MRNVTTNAILQKAEKAATGEILVCSIVYLCEPGFEVPARGFKALSLNLTVRHIIATYMIHYT